MPWAVETRLSAIGLDARLPQHGRVQRSDCGVPTTSIRSRFRKVDDGTSKTFMVGECVVEQDYHSAAFFADGDWATCGNPLNYFIIPADETTIKSAPKLAGSSRL